MNVTRGRDLAEIVREACHVVNVFAGLAGSRLHRRPGARLFTVWAEGRMAEGRRSSSSPPSRTSSALSRIVPRLPCTRGARTPRLHDSPRQEHLGTPAPSGWLAAFQPACVIERCRPHGAHLPGARPADT